MPQKAIDHSFKKLDDGRKCHHKRCVLDGFVTDAGGSSTHTSLYKELRISNCFVGTCSIEISCLII